MTRPDSQLESTLELDKTLINESTTVVRLFPSCY
jgi:hypothetical protein